MADLEGTGEADALSDGDNAALSGVEGAGGLGGAMPLGAPPADATAPSVPYGPGGPSYGPSLVLPELGPALLTQSQVDLAVMKLGGPVPLDLPPKGPSISALSPDEAWETRMEAFYGPSPYAVWRQKGVVNPEVLASVAGEAQALWVERCLAMDAEAPLDAEGEFPIAKALALLSEVEDLFEGEAVAATVAAGLNLPVEDPKVQAFVAAVQRVELEVAANPGRLVEVLSRAQLVQFAREPWRRDMLMGRAMHTVLKVEMDAIEGQVGRWLGHTNSPHDLALSGVGRGELTTERGMPSHIRRMERTGTSPYVVVGYAADPAMRAAFEAGLRARVVSEAIVVSPAQGPARTPPASRPATSRTGK